MSKLEALFSIAGRTALVTGGSVGIGAMIARAYVQAGARVYIASRKLDDLEEVATELSAEGECIALQADLSTEEGTRKLAADLLEREDSLDILVNNAGATWGAPVDDYPGKAWDRVVGLNVKATFLLTQSLLPALRASSTSARSNQSGSLRMKTTPIPRARPPSTSSRARSPSASRKTTSP